jgi:hypothetical protein
MPFNTDKSVSKVVKEFQIVYTESNFIVETPLSVSDYFRTELELVTQEGAVDTSEYAVCEKFIYPILKEVWKSYRDQLLLWSHPTLVYDQALSGVPDYVIAKKSALGRVVFERPYCVVVEAKQDDFEEGWGQCLAEMVAVQKMNQIAGQMIFGIVSNGKTWEFGCLQELTFTKNIKTYVLSDLTALFAALNYVFEQCKRLVENVGCLTSSS